MAYASPSPELAPVISAVFPFKLFILYILPVAGGYI
jgi:hypothetical protein